MEKIYWIKFISVEKFKILKYQIFSIKLSLFRICSEWPSNDEKNQVKYQRFLIYLIL